MDYRTKAQCQARGCEGCVVCDQVNFTPEQLEEYREFEAQLNVLFNPKPVDSKPEEYQFSFKF